MEAGIVNKQLMRSEKVTASAEKDGFVKKKGDFIKLECFPQCVGEQACRVK